MCAIARSGGSNPWCLSDNSIMMASFVPSAHVMNQRNIPKDHGVSCSAWKPHRMPTQARFKQAHGPQNKLLSKTTETRITRVFQPFNEGKMNVMDIISYFYANHCYTSCTGVVITAEPEQRT
jgi:hypothetical protein